jgi:hypothetical protein
MSRHTRRDALSSFGSLLSLVGWGIIIVTVLSILDKSRSDFTKNVWFPLPPVATVSDYLLSYYEHYVFGVPLRDLCSDPLGSLVCCSDRNCKEWKFHCTANNPFGSEAEVEAWCPSWRENVFGGEEFYVNYITMNNGGAQLSGK